jgi:hypothetical protein
MWTEVACNLIGTDLLPVTESGPGVVYHSLPSNAKVKNEWSHILAPPIRLHNVIRDKFIFSVIQNILRYTWQLVFAFFTKQAGVFK